MNKTPCSRCGKKTAQAKIIPLSGTSCGAEVCADCYRYLIDSPVALDRFAVLERAKHRLFGGGGKVKKKKNRRIKT